MRVPCVLSSRFFTASSSALSAPPRESPWSLRRGRLIDGVFVESMLVAGTGSRGVAEVGESEIVNDVSSAALAFVKGRRTRAARMAVPRGRGNGGASSPGLTIEDIKQGVSRIRNPVIARVFRELGLIEQWGSGVRRIFALAVELSLPAPQIEEIGMRVRFTIRLKTPINADGPAHTAVTAEVTGEVTAEVGKLLTTLTKEMSRHELQALLGLKHDEHFRLAYLQPALAVGLIERTLPDKPNSRLQKYRLTPKGRMLLNVDKRSA
ncbi:MAG: ATP-binding protein [Verrucomicrobiota bacterium]|nr:ATP-binding protein [Verrucomicrobiota bacterium]